MRLLLAALCFLVSSAFAADLVLLSGGKSEYQIVVPDASPSEALAASLQETARLMQTAFRANGAEVPIVKESARDSAKPALLLGDTAAARKLNLDLGKLKGWGYYWKASDRDLVLAGRDVPAPGKGAHLSDWDRVGTAKATVDFLRTYMGTRFLYPEIGPRQSFAADAKIDLLASPAIEFLPMSTIAVPAELEVQKTPLLDSWTGYPAGGSFFHLAQNRFPCVDDAFGGHTYERAVPPAKYFDAHPEYYALNGKKRLKPDGANAQYCISNPDVQELIYQDLIAQLDQGYRSVDVGQPDGFRPCQCDQCKALYDTGTDWSEKLWIFHRKLAERVLGARPAATVTLFSYILTAAPPKTFTKFPSNVQIMLTGTNEEDIAPWRSAEVPQGFSGYIYNWCPNLSTRYTPMRTPGYVEQQAKRIVANRIQAIYQDGPGVLSGLEGPVYYTMGRMYDDPEHLHAKELVSEFCDAAFGKASAPMLQFYSQLYHGIELYSEYLGTRDPAWAYQDMNGRRRKYLTDPMQFLGFLYTPELLAALEKQLATAEQSASAGKVRTRLALVRREFDYLRGVARVVHLYHALEIQPDRAIRDRLLDAIDARNAEVASYFDERGRPKPVGNWAFVSFPPIGHNALHLRLAYDGYQEPYSNTPFNWDTKTMRNAPLEGTRQLGALPTAAELTLDSPEWQEAAVAELVSVPGGPAPTRKTTARLAFDATQLYVLVESELPPGAVKGAESFAVYLAPGVGDRAFRFTVGSTSEEKADAAAGFVADVMDPRYGKFDPDWSGAWTYESRVEPGKNRWLAFLKIPFQTLGVEAPKGGFWRANFVRTSGASPETAERAIWSTQPGVKSFEDRNAFGEVAWPAAK